MAKRRTLKRRWLEEKAKRESLERLIHVNAVKPIVVVREPIRMALSNRFSRQSVEMQSIEFFKRLMLADWLKWEVGELDDETYKQWCDIVEFHVEDLQQLPYVTITMTFYICPTKNKYLP